MSDKIQAEETRVISDLETIKVMSDPLRIQIMEYVATANWAGELRTVKQLAEQLGLTPTKLYYHINLLEKHDLLQVADTQVVSGIIEKHYQVSAYGYKVDKKLIPTPNDAGGEENLNTLIEFVSGIFNSTLADLRRGIQSGAISFPQSEDDTEKKAILGRRFWRLPPENVPLVYQRMRDLIESFEELETDEGDPNASIHALTLAMYPRQEPPTSTEKDSTND